MGVRGRRGPIFGGVLLLLLCFSSLAFAEVTGVYELREKGELRRLSVNDLKGIGSLQFVLYVEAGDFTGSMMGMAELKENTATYKTGGCQFTITFSGNKALIRNADIQCRDYLKPGILLDGNYIKQP
ncbi:MAG: hypothetical protein M1438_16740 [Deltaproteobacteria bacterium]|nr:hypothetical protein [Deltaproteobacteria bacterium]